MKRTVLIHTFGGILMGLLLLASGGNSSYNANFSLILPTWGVLGTILLYESLRPYYPILCWKHLVVLYAIWGAMLLISMLFIFPMVCGVLLITIIVPAVAPLIPAGRGLAALILGTITHFICVGMFFLVVEIFSKHSLGFAAVLVIGLLGASFGVGVHAFASWLQPDAQGLYTYQKFKPQWRTQRDQYFLTDAEYATYEAAQIAAQRDLAVLAEQEGHK